MHKTGIASKGAFQRFCGRGISFAVLALWFLRVAGAADTESRDSPNPLQGSALASERPLRFDFSPEVEAFLAGCKQAASTSQTWGLRITWQLLKEEPRDWNRDGLGPRSFKTGLDWIHPPEGRQVSREGRVSLAGKGDRFYLSHLNENGDIEEWWQKEGSYLYSSRMNELLPFVTRYPAQQALESGMLAYGEGLCLVLWAFNPEEYLRRSEDLKLGDLVQVDSHTCRTLISTPNWIKEPATLPTRHYFPYNESKLRSWASFTPVVTYFVNPQTYRIEGAVFTFYTFERSHPGRWTVIPEVSGERFETWVLKWSDTPFGTIPSEVEGFYFVGDELKRHLLISIAPDTGAEFKPLSLPRGRRQYEPWPPFSSAVYRQRIASGNKDYANRVGFINALAFEGKLSEALQEFKSLLADFNGDSDLVPESLGGIDWHLGFALYEILQNPEAPENRALWTEFEPREPYIGILGRALDFFARWHRSEYSELVEKYFQLYQEKFGLKARIMYAMERPLIEHVETETDRALELQRLIGQAETEDLRLQGLIACVEAFLHDKNYEGALAAIEGARGLFATQGALQTFETLSASWNERINKALEDIARRETEERVRLLNDLIGRLNARVKRTADRSSGIEIKRLQAIIARAEAELQELGQ